MVQRCGYRWKRRLFWNLEAKREIPIPLMRLGKRNPSEIGRRFRKPPCIRPRAGNAGRISWPMMLPSSTMARPLSAKPRVLFYQPIFANKDFNLTWSPTHAEASVAGNPGLYLRRVPGQAGDEISRGIYTTVCRKVDDDWKVVLDLGSVAHAQSKPQN